MLIVGLDLEFKNENTTLFLHSIKYTSNIQTFGLGFFFSIFHFLSRCLILFRSDFKS